MTVSMFQLSVGVFTPFLGSLSGLLDQTAAHAEARKIDPSILLNARLYPNMYSLTRQIGEAIRHAVVGCGLLAGVDPPAFPERPAEARGPAAGLCVFPRRAARGRNLLDSARSPLL